VSADSFHLIQLLIYFYLLCWFFKAPTIAQFPTRPAHSAFFFPRPAEQRYLHQLYQRCQNGEDLSKALRLTRLNYLARGELQQHTPFSHKTGQALIAEALRVGAPEVAYQAISRPDEFGLYITAAWEYHPLLIYHSKVGDLSSMLDLYELMKRRGHKPDSATCFVLVKGCVDNGRADLAELVVQEFEGAGVRVREGTRLYLQQRRDAAAAVGGAAVTAA
jgi:pentatricopeptide repeat protein